MTTENPTAEDNDTQTKPRVSALMAVLITIGILIVGTVLTLTVIYQIALHSTKEPGIVATKFVTAVQSNDPKTAYALTSPSFKIEKNETEFTEILTAVSKTLNKGKIQVVGRKNKISDSKESATIGINIGSGQGIMNANVLLQKVDSDWLVANVSFSEGLFSGTSLDTSQ